MVTTYTTYNNIVGNLPRSLTQTGKEPSVALETAYFQKTIGSIKTIDDLINNTRVFRYVMKAFGLEDQDTAKGLVKKLLTDGVDNTNGLAQKLNDSRYTALATAFNFARDGTATTSTTAATQGVVNQYIRQTLEDQAGQDNPGVQMALYFQRAAPSIKTAYDILADPTLTNVVETALGLPSGMASESIDTQATQLGQKLNVADLQDPTKVNNLISRFAAVYDANNATSDPILSLFTPGTPSLDVNLLIALNAVKNGGS
jgi:hypothetical protein